MFPDNELYQSPLLGDGSNWDFITGRGGYLLEGGFSTNDEFIIAHKKFRDLSEVAMSLKFVKGGPRKEIFFRPEEVKAAIVSCGGLCPGLNVVIWEIYMCLHFSYGIDEIYGVKWGYNGFW